MRTLRTVSLATLLAHLDPDLVSGERTRTTCPKCKLERLTSREGWLYCLSCGYFVRNDVTNSLSHGSVSTPNERKRS